MVRVDSGSCAEIGGRGHSRLRGKSVSKMVKVNKSCGRTGGDCGASAGEPDIQTWGKGRK